MLTPGGLRDSLFVACMACLALSLASCETFSGSPTAPASYVTPVTPTVAEPGDVKYYPSDQPLKLAIEYFNHGDYGLADRYYSDAVAKNPRDVAAWIGLAASNDRLSRFDLADRAYASAIKLSGETTQILNNQGYSYMLRGNFKLAREKFMKAYAREPNNPTIANNLRLLDSSSQYVRRLPND
jgi:Flp pilus assembly protein TadD